MIKYYFVQFILDSRLKFYLPSPTLERQPLAINPLSSQVSQEQFLMRNRVISLGKSVTIKLQQTGLHSKTFHLSFPSQFPEDE